MKLLRTLAALGETMFRRSRFEQEMEEELRFHIEQRTEDLAAQGLPRADAARRARLEFGGVESHKEDCREARGALWFDELARHAHLALRSMRKSPGFTALAIFSLAIGIGANAAMFSLLHRLLLEPLPVRDAGRLQHVVLSTARQPYYRISYPKFVMLRDNFDLFDSLFGWSRRTLPLTAGQRSQSADAALVTGNYFETLGIRPALGRLIRTDDDRSGAAKVVVLSHALWRSFFEADRAIAGKTLKLGTETYEVIGVAPAEFTGLEPGEPADLWLPFHAAERFAPAMIKNEGMLGFYAFGRLKPGVPLESAQAALRDGWPRFSIPRQRSLGDFSRPEYLVLEDGSRGYSQVRIDFSRALVALAALVAVVLLIACANLATLLFVRGVRSRGEMSVRLALGATRGQLVRQWMTECLLLSFAGGFAGVLLAYWITELLLLFVPEAERTWLRFTADSTVIGASLIVSLVAACLFGLLPAWRASRVDVQSVIRQSSPAVAGGRGPLATFVLAGQIAASLVLVVAAILFARTLWNLTTNSGGFARGAIAYGWPSFFRAQFPRDRIAPVMNEAVEQLARSPHVAAVSMAGGVPIVSGSGGWGWVHVPGYTPAPGEDNVAYVKPVAPRYFDVMGIQMIAGRDFDHRDRVPQTPAVAIVNEQFVRRYFQGRDPIGASIAMGKQAPTQIVGVVKDTKDRTLREDFKDIVYYPLTSNSASAVVARGKPDVAASAVEAEIRAVLSAVAKGVPLETGTLEAAIHTSLRRDRLVAQLSAGFGLLGVLLAAIGLYGAVAHAVKSRTREIGVRMALGAGRGEIVRLVLRSTLAVTAVGIAIGIPAAAIASRAVESLLFDVRTWDPATLLASALLLAVAGLSAGLWPALRAASLDPARSLRYE